MIDKDIIRILIKVSPESKIDGCWEWAGAKNSHGYGKLADGNGGWVFAHRAAWVAANGEISAGNEVCHECDNPGCVNPDHLFLGTHAENMADCKNKGRAACNEGNKNPNAKLTESDVIKIRSSKMSAKILAEKYGVSTTLIYYIKKRLAWCHVPEQADNASELMVLE